jgi:cellulose synthase/poly-beta-1,6-N-acetylglucosamine synthase-like glycosyltransferase
LGFLEDLLDSDFIMGFRRIARLIISGLGIREVSQRKLRKFEKNLSSLKNVKRKNKFSTIAVVVPCYGHEKYLKQAFDSIYAQKRPFDEVIFVVDSSPDNSLQLLKTLKKKNNVDCKIILNKENLGQAKSINVGVENSSSDVIMILNDDDCLVDTASKVSLDQFNKYKNIYLLGGGAKSITVEDNLINFEKLKFIHLKGLKNINGIMICGCAILVSLF